MGTSLKKVAKKTKEYKYVLLAMRHAKTEPFGGNGSDVGRELTDKGRKQAKAVAKGLAAFKMVPTRIACSSATRARQTCDRMLKVFGDDPKVDYRQSLYEGGRAIRVRRARANQGKHRTLLVLGHEPTISIACQWLASTESDPTLLDLLNLGMSPGLDRRIRLERAIQPVAAAQRRTHRAAYRQRLRVGLACSGLIRNDEHSAECCDLTSSGFKVVWCF